MSKTFAVGIYQNIQITRRWLRCDIARTVRRTSTLGVQYVLIQKDTCNKWNLVAAPSAQQVKRVPTKFYPTQLQMSIFASTCICSYSQQTAVRKVK